MAVWFFSTSDSSWTRAPTPCGPNTRPALPRTWRPSDSAYTFVLGVDATRVYTASGPLGSTIVACPKTGCAGSPTVIASGSDTALNLAQDAANVYWTAHGRVLKASKGGGAAVTLASGSYPWGIAVDGKNVYWGDQQTKSVMKVPVDGGTPTLVASAVAGPGLIAERDDTLYVSDGEHLPCRDRR